MKNSNNIFSLLSSSSLVIFQITIALFTIYALGVPLAGAGDDGDDGVPWELKRETQHTRHGTSARQM